MRKSFTVTKTVLVLGLGLASAACSVQEPQAAYNTLPIVETGEPAIDTSAHFLPADELAQFDLIDEGGLSTVSRNVQSSDGVSIFVYGPLHDRRAVRGKQVGVSFARMWGANPGETFTVLYGFYGQRTDRSASLIQGTYGNFYIFLDVPQDAQGFYFKIVSSLGTIYSDAALPYSLKVYDAIASVSLAGGQLTVNYSGDAIGYHETLHYGYNNWQAVSDMPMYSYSYTVPKYVQPGGYASATITIPAWANYIDFAVNGNGIWDNNGGGDWHFSLKPLVTAQVVSIESANKRVSIYYSNGGLNPPTAHYGYDNWQGIGESTLSATYGGQWVTTVVVPATAKTLNTVFRNGSVWENNFNMNWNLEI